MVDSTFQDELAKLEEHLSTEVDWELLDAKGQERARFLYRLPGGLVQGRFIGAIQNVDNYDGHEALRQLPINCQPQARNRAITLLRRRGVPIVQREADDFATTVET